MKSKFVAECKGVVEVRADLKRLALIKTAELLNTEYQKLSVESMNLEIVSTEEAYAGYYLVRYNFKFVCYADSEEEVFNLAKGEGKITIISIE